MTLFDDRSSILSFLSTVPGSCGIGCAKFRVERDITMTHMTWTRREKEILFYYCLRWLLSIKRDFNEMGQLPFKLNDIVQFFQLQIRVFLRLLLAQRWNLVSLWRCYFRQFWVIWFGFATFFADVAVEAE